jgi:RNA polymerase sigma factor (sigma-70 family)
MEPELTQPSLLSRVRNPSDTAAWREFDSKYRELIVRYCRAHGLQAADCEDVRQSVMISLSKALRTFEYQPARGKFRHYLGRTVRNAVFQHFGRPKDRHKGLDTAVLATQPADDASETDELWETEWIDHHYRLAMKTIRETYDPRSIEVFDRLLDGEGVDAVADAFGMSTQAVHKVKQRIRNRMKELVQQQIRDEDEPAKPRP